MLRAASLARRNNAGGAPPPYVPPTGSWYQAPPPAYSPNPQGYYGWTPSTQAFPNAPDPGTVYMHDSPPPYPGIVPGGNAPTAPGGAPYNGQAYGQVPMGGGYPASPPGYSQPGYPNGGGQPDYQNGGGQAGFQNGPAGGFQMPPGYGASGGFQQAPYPGASGFQQPPYPGAQPGYPTLPNSGQPGGAMGFAQPQSSKFINFSKACSYSFHCFLNFSFLKITILDSKEEEAAQSAYYDPNRPQTAFVPPPPAYYVSCPSYLKLIANIF
jgi:WW domain-binding protein 2